MAPKQAISSIRATNQVITGTASRQHSDTASRRVLSLLVVFWLNLVAAPCSMAFDGDHSCVHCPPAQEQHGASHHAHHGDTASSDCDTLNSDCSDSTTASVDARQSQLKSKFKDSAELVMIVATPWHDTAPVAAAFTLATRVPPDPVAAPPPTYLLNCVFRK